MPNGKGSGRRPPAVADSHIESEWARIFGPHGPFPPASRIGNYEDAQPHEVVVDHRLLRPAQVLPTPPDATVHIAPLNLTGPDPEGGE